MFLDRDGVINRRPMGDYVRSWETFEFLPGVLPALRQLSSRFDRVIVVTNQQGIGKGLMTTADLEVIHNKMLEAVTEAGGRIDAVLFCPDLSVRPNNCRKPAPAMAWEARRKFPDISFKHSVMVGDTPADVEFGNRLGMQTVFVGNTDSYKSLKVRAGRCCESLAQLMLIIDEIIG